ncbi:hypothetical protein [Viscerimonas tarda]
MKRKIVLIFASFLFLVACGPTPKEFNDALETTVADAEKSVNEHDAAVLDALASSKTDSIIPLTKTVLAKLVQDLEQLKLIKSPSNGEKLKTAAEDYIEALITLVKAQAVYSNYTDSISDAEIEIMDNTSVDALSTVETSRARFVDSQNTFAKAKGLK